MPLAHTVDRRPIQELHDNHSGDPKLVKVDRNCKVDKFGTREKELLEPLPAYL